jgi:hypothetical protein
VLNPDDRQDWRPGKRCKGVRVTNSPGELKCAGISPNVRRR